MRQYRNLWRKKFSMHNSLYVLEGEIIHGEAEV